MSRELEPKRFPQLFLGLLLGTHWSAIGHSLVTVPEVFAKVNSVQFFLVSKVTNGVFFPLDFSSSLLALIRVVLLSPHKYPCTKQFAR